MQRWRRMLGEGRFQLLVTGSVGLLAYANSFHSPFVFDDLRNIVDNPALRNLGSLWPPLSMRWFAVLTFAVNHRLGGLDPFGYHVLNFAVHLASALLVHRLAHLLLRTPFLAPAPESRREGLDHGDFIPFVSALIFVAHPIQTQAVTYVVQRYASLATMLYLLSLVLFLEWRLGRELAPAPRGGEERSARAAAGGGGRGRVAYAGSLLAAALAMKTKEIAFTLPLVVALCEALLFRGRAFARALRVLPLLATVLVIPVNLYLVARVANRPYDLDRASRFLTAMPRADYLLTQFRVVVTYVRLLFFPVGQNLDHDYPVYHTFFTPPVYLSFAFLLATVAAGVWLARAAARGSRGPASPEGRERSRTFGLISFGIFWFFVTLSVESSFIPLKEVIAEYRLYLPSVGASVALGALLLFVARRIAAAAGAGVARRLAVPVLVTLAVGSLATATFLRNHVWRDTLRLAEDTAGKSPNSSRARNNLGRAYHLQGWIDRALVEYETALRLNPYYDIPHCNLALAYRQKGMYDKAAHHDRMCQYGRKLRAQAPAGPL